SSDALQLNHVTVTSTFSLDDSLPARERLHLDGAYQRYDWRGRVRWTVADFYDLFGPTKYGRKGFVAEVMHTRTLVFDDPRRVDLKLGGTLARGLDRLPEYQTVAIPVDRLATLEATLTYTDVRKSLGYVDDEGGHK